MFGDSSYGVEVYGGLPQVSASSAPASSEELVYHYARSQSQDFVDPACPIEWSHPLNRGLVSRWKVIPNSGWRGGNKFFDLARGGKNPNNGTLANSPTWVSGARRGGYGALSFPGTGGSVVSVPSSSVFQPTSSFSVVGWFYFDPGQADFVNSVIVGKGDQFGSGAARGWFVWAINAAYSLRLQVAPADGGSYITDTSFGSTATSVWKHMALVWDDAAKTSSFYLDTVVSPDSPVSITAGIASNSSNLALGYLNPDTMRGKLDDWSYYNRTLSAAEIRQLYQEQLRGSPETLRWVGAKTYFLPVATPATTTTAYGGSKSTELVDPSCPLDWSHPLNRGLVGCWKVVPNWRGGLILRDLVRGGKKPNDGTFTNGPLWSRSKVFDDNGSVYFDGTNDYVSATCPNISTAFSAFVVMKAAVAAGSSGAHKYPLSTDAENFGIVWTHSAPAFDGCCYMIGAGTYPRVSWTDKPAANTPCMVGITWDGANFSAYVNGISQGSAANSTFGTTPTTLGIGGLTSNYIECNIESAFLYNRALSAAEVQALYQEQRQGSPETLNWVKTKSYYLPVQPTPTSISYGGSKYTEIVDPACPVDWSHPLNRGLVGCWIVLPNPGWSGGLNTRDATGNGNHGTASTRFGETYSGTWVPGKHAGSRALKLLSADNDYQAVTSSSSLDRYVATGKLTASAWIKPTTAAVCGLLGQISVATSKGWCIIARTSGSDTTIDANVGENTGSWFGSSGTIVNGTWAMVTLTYDGSVGKIYINGVETKSVSKTSDFATGIGFAICGSFFGTATFNGVVENVRVYPRNLSASEVQALYQEQLRGSSETLNWVRAKSYSIFTPSSSSGGVFLPYWASRNRSRIISGGII